MHEIAKWHIIIVLVVMTNVVYGQMLDVANGKNITSLPGDELNAEWSHDSKDLLFQSVFEGRSNVLLYLSDSDTILYLSKLDYNFRNPVWHPDGDKVVFDSDKAGWDYLYVLDLKTYEVTTLFNRKIKCRNASFSGSSRQVYFTGYDELSRSWELYSYDFIYDNLNKLTNHKLRCSDSDIGVNGKQIVYSKDNPFDRTKSLEVINWYGEHLIGFNDFNCEDPSWGPAGFKLFFVSDMDNKEKELYSIWKDGSHLERLTFDEISVACPVVSPDGTKIAMSILTESGWDIIILSLDEY